MQPLLLRGKLGLVSVGTSLVFNAAFRLEGIASFYAGPNWPARNHAPHPYHRQQRKRIAKQLEKDRERLRKRYPEIHGKVVDFITHAVSDDVLYLSVRFTDGTNFSIRYAAEMFVVGVDLSDWKTGNMDMIRQYMKPIPR